MFLMRMSSNGPMTLLKVFRSNETHSKGLVDVAVA